MKMFGKNYDKEIEDLHKRINEIIKTQNENQKALFKMVNDLHDLIDKFQDSVIEMAKVQKSHKEAIMLLSEK